MRKYAAAAVVGSCLSATPGFARGLDELTLFGDDVPASTAVIADVRLGTYPVNASSIEGLNRAMREVLLPIGGARPATASTKVTMTPMVSYAEVEGQCLITSSTVDLDVLVTLPEWRQRRYANETERNAWDGYVSALRQHEELHVQTAEEYAERFQSALRGLPAARDCDVQRVRVGEVETNVLARHRAAQELIDFRVRQGAAARQ